MSQIDDYIKKLRDDGKLDKGFILNAAQRKLVMQSFAEGQIKLKKNTLQGISHSVIKNKDGVPFILCGFTEEIPQGAQSIMKVAQNLETGEFCLVRILRLEDSKAEKYKKDEAERETEALKKLPSFFKGYQFRDNPSKQYNYKHYNFIKILPGITLEQANLGKADPIIQCEIALKILQALQNLHKLGLVHRDIHPGNILVNLETMELSIVDFGLSVITDKEGYWYGPNVVDIKGTGPTIRFANGSDAFSVWNCIYFKDKKINKIITDLKVQSVENADDNGPISYNKVDLQPSIELIKKYQAELKQLDKNNSNDKTLRPGV